MISSEVKTSSYIYTQCFSVAQEILSALDVAKNSANLDDSVKDKNNSSDNFSVADELLKLKNLLDLGILTEEEFEKEKYKLLNK